jgi:hypothetical protein
MRNALGLLLFLASTASAADLPRYWTVHIDYAADRAAYERVEKEFSTTRRDFYAAHSAAPAPVIQFSAPDGVYYGLRPRGTFTDFDKPNPLGDAMKELQAKLDPISAATHKTLRKHHSEIWQIDGDLTSIRDEAVPKHVLMRTDDVQPVNDEEYGKAMKALRDELVAKDVAILAFFSAYGDGKHHYLFMSDAPLKIRTVGKLATTTDVAAKPRPDLNAIDAGHWLHY